MWKFLLLGVLVVLFSSDWPLWVSKPKSSTSSKSTIRKSNERPKGGGSNIGFDPRFKKDEDGWYTFVLDIKRIPDPMHIDDNDFSMEELSKFNLSGWMNYSSTTLKGLSKLVNVIRVRPGPKEWNIELAFGSPFIEIDGMYEALFFYHLKTETISAVLQQPMHAFVDELDRNIMIKIVEDLRVNGKGTFGLFFKNIFLEASATIPSKGKAKLLSLKTRHSFDSMNVDMQNGFLNDAHSINEVWSKWNAMRAARTPKEDNNEQWEAFETAFASCILENFNKNVKDCTMDELRSYVINFFMSGETNTPPLGCVKCLQCN